MTDQQQHHAVYPVPTHDELARQRFVINLQGHCFEGLQAGHRTVYDQVVRPAFERQHHRAPTNRGEVRKAMERHPFHQTWSALRRTAQEMMWDSAQASVDRQAGALIAKARQVRDSNRKKGSLRLDPSVEAPRYLTAVDIHVMPGNYHTEYEPDDVYQAAVFDRGSYMLNRGKRGPLHDSLGKDVMAFVRKHYPRLEPKRILDMGCSIGASGIPVAEAFPDAEFHGIDVAAPLLRYGHARAESLGVAVHFSQQAAEHTDFADESFDLIFSCLLMHETSGSSLRQYMKEIHRLLKPGGITVHIEGPFMHWADKTPFEQFIGNWGTHYNAEPFCSALGDTDFPEVLSKLGFPKQHVRLERSDSGFGHVLGAQK
ncbi:MAG: methyltransferase domain-containing protein [Alphaproteobacteria bacterium]|nr:methyltransferase domain-containing protein [Alphaproteobacteria bacterium]